MIADRSAVRSSPKPKALLGSESVGKGSTEGGMEVTGVGGGGGGGGSGDAGDDGAGLVCPSPSEHELLPVKQDINRNYSEKWGTKLLSYTSKKLFHGSRK